MDLDISMGGKLVRRIGTEHTAGGVGRKVVILGVRARLLLGVVLLLIYGVWNMDLLREPTLERMDKVTSGDVLTFHERRFRWEDVSIWSRICMNPLTVRSDKTPDCTFRRHPMAPLL